MVDYYSNYKVLTNMRCAPGEVTCEPKKYVLHQCGTPAPAVGSAGVPAGATMFEIPVQKVYTAGTVTVNFLEMLGELKRVQHLDMRFITSPCVRKLAGACGSISDTKKPSNATAEPEAAAQWEAALASAGVVFTDFWGTGASGDASKDVAFDASTDPGALQRAEWIKFVSAFFNKESEANAIYARIEAAYRLASQRANAVASKPKVAFVSFEAGYEWGGSVVPDLFLLDHADYKVEIATAAGANVIAAEKRETLPLADLKARLVGVDTVVDETYAWDPTSYTLQTFLSTFKFTAEDVASGDYPFLTYGSVLRFDRIAAKDPASGSVGLGWYESAVPNPAMVVEDMLRHLQPSVCGDDVPCEPAFFRNIALCQVPVWQTAAHCECEAKPLQCHSGNAPAEPLTCPAAAGDSAACEGGLPPANPIYVSAPPPASAAGALPKAAAAAFAAAAVLAAMAL
mmetsp:Transcript_45970/g.146766  ORF Transcript_45970/g.146766 Transcript_45970/m.146766 type:complete len:456 (-) Transcript_45970:148-1515(-)